MPTIAQKKAEQEKLDRSARNIAYGTMGLMLTLSTSANVLTAWDQDITSKVIAGVPPISLFITSLLYERMRTNVYIQSGMLLTILVSLAFSWYHISVLAYTHHQPLYISIFLPVIIDVPMLFAGTIIINQRATPEVLPTPAKAPATAKKAAPVIVSTPAKKAAKATPKHIKAYVHP